MRTHDSLFRILPHSTPSPHHCTGLCDGVCDIGRGGSWRVGEANSERLIHLNTCGTHYSYIKNRGTTLIYHRKGEGLVEKTRQNSQFSTGLTHRIPPWPSLSAASLISPHHWHMTRDRKRIHAVLCPAAGMKWSCWNSGNCWESKTWCSIAGVLKGGRITGISGCLTQGTRVRQRLRGQTEQRISVPAIVDSLSRKARP